VSSLSSAQHLTAAHATLRPGGSRALAMDTLTLMDEIGLARRLAWHNFEAGNRQAYEEAQALAHHLDRQLTERFKVEVPF